MEKTHWGKIVQVVLPLALLSAFMVLYSGVSISFAKAVYALVWLAISIHYFAGYSKKVNNSNSKENPILMSSILKFILSLVIAISTLVFVWLLYNIKFEIPVLSHILNFSAKIHYNLLFDVILVIVFLILPISLFIIFERYLYVKVTKLSVKDTLVFSLMATLLVISLSAHNNALEGDKKAYLERTNQFGYMEEQITATYSTLNNLNENWSNLDSKEKKAHLKEVKQSKERIKTARGFLDRHFQLYASEYLLNYGLLSAYDIFNFYDDKLNATQDAIDRADLEKAHKEVEQLKRAYKNISGTIQDISFKEDKSPEKHAKYFRMVIDAYVEEYKAMSDSEE
ncbi:hypothetical protein PRVXH_002336 [Proteinivorax hydrogeniformans]|uniref:Uncharacterized protein n=1 Tax=Proteinivorax hydrogeniformans TaxID=1826727 RepID=A0AAU8HS49_9FIRM